MFRCFCDACDKEIDQTKAAHGYKSHSLQNGIIVNIQFSVGKNTTPQLCADCKTQALDIISAAIRRVSNATPTTESQPKSKSCCPHPA